jgi:hypothetical protein
MNMKHLGIIALAAVLGFAMPAYGKNGDPSSPQTKTYTVAFNSNGGGSVNPQTVTEGGKASEPQGVTKTGTRLTDGTTGEQNGNFALEPADTNTFGTVSDITVAIWGDTELSLSAKGCLLYIGGGQIKP